MYRYNLCIKNTSLILLFFSLLLIGCKKEEQPVDSVNAKELQAFDARAKKLRFTLLHEHTYDLKNVPIADSLYRESEKIHSVFGKITALEIKSFAYSAYTEKDDEFIKTVDEYISLAKNYQKDPDIYYDAISLKIERIVDQKRYMEAISMAREAMKRAEKSKDSVGLYSCNYNMGTIYKNRGNFNIAIPYYLKAMKYADKDSTLISNISIDLADGYTAEKNFAKAMQYAKQSMDYANTEIYRVWAEKCYLIVLFASGKHDQFISEYNKSVFKTKKVDDVLPDYIRAELQIDVALCQKDWNKAIALAKTIEYDGIQAECLVSIYEAMGDYKKALESQKLYDKLTKQVQSEMLISDLSELDTKLGNGQLKIEAEKLKSERRLMIFIMVIVIIVAIFLIGCIHIYYAYRRRIGIQRRKASMERERFYRNVTHQLRTPLTVVIGMIDQLRTHIPESDKVGCESLQAAHRQSSNLLQLTMDLIEALREGTLADDLTAPDGDISVNATEADISVNATEADTSVKAPVVSADDKPSSDSEVQNASRTKVFANINNGKDKVSILVAEDNDDVALLICNMLHDQGYIVARASDGQEAWEMLQDELPDLLLTDIAMPRMDGITLMRHVRQDDTMSHLPIIVVSARVEDHERLEGINAGAEVYLAKPFINEELLLRVKKILEQRDKLRKVFSNGLVPDPETPDVHAQIINIDERKFIDSINNIIKENMHSGDVTTKFLADALGLSVSTLNRKMKNITGLTSTIYIRTRRINIAKELLSTSSRSIAEIEAVCGFNTSGYFTRLFKSETGMTPLEYRHHVHTQIS